MCAAATSVAVAAALRVSAREAQPERLQKAPREPPPPHRRADLRANTHATRAPSQSLKIRLEVVEEHHAMRVQIA